MKILLLIVGLICMLLGLIGIFIPIWPTTPFLIIASFCFLRSSQRLYDILYHNKYFGPYLQHYYTKQGIYKEDKQRVYIFLWLSMLVSIFITENIVMKAVLLFILCAVNIHILCIKTRQKTSM